jgi:mRNA-degrading endonuclease RelE of RelBE toxin-antitoxin system
MEREPLSGDVIPLKGPYEGSYRRRVGAFRVIFAVKPDTAIVTIADIVRRTSTTY